MACNFAQIPDGCDLIADNLSHLSIMTFVELDNEITTELRKCFGLSAGVADLDIPPYHDHDGTQLGLAVQSTLYYIAGAMMSTLQKLAGRTARTNSSLSEELTVFCARNTVKRADAEADKLPCVLVSSRSEGKLLYSSASFFRFVLAIEFAYSRLLTMEHLIAYGGELLNAVRSLTSNWPFLKEAFEECASAAREQAAMEENTFDRENLIIEKLLRLYMRIRGKDAVKTIVGVLKQSQLAQGKNGRCCRLRKE